MIKKIERNPILMNIQLNPAVTSDQQIRLD